MRDVRSVASKLKVVMLPMDKSVSHLILLLRIIFLKKKKLTTSNFSPFKRTVPFEIDSLRRIRWCFSI